MPDAVLILSSPPLRPIWTNVKKKAEDEAKKLKQEDKFTALDKKFASGLGPDLEKWAKNYDAADLKKLESAKTKLDTSLKQYLGFSKASGLDAKIIKILTDGITGLEDELKERFKRAEELSKGGGGAIQAYPIYYRGSVTPTATKFLKSEPLAMDFDGTIDLDATDAANLANLQKAFQSEMESRIKAQLGFLNQWLTEKDKHIDELVKKYEALQKAGFPTTPQLANARAQAIKEMEALGKEIKTLPEEFTKIVQDWAQNAREQQARVSMVTAVKNARVKTFNEKAWRVRLGQAIKVVLVVAAIALSIAAIVVTAGSTAPVFIGLAAAGLAIGGISSIAGLGQMFKDNATIEKKLMANVTKDVETVRNALNPVAASNSSIAKHVTELRNLMKIREDSIGKYKTEIQKQTAAINSYISALDKLKGDQSIQPAELAKRQKNIDALNEKVKSTQEAIKKLEASNAAGQKILDDLTQLNIQLDKISGQSANTLLGNLKDRFTSLDGWIDLGNNVGGLVSSASGVQVS
jgi:DNA repair exonuclease SbcCD ATPase subunit